MAGSGVKRILMNFFSNPVNPPAEELAAHQAHVTAENNITEADLRAAREEVEQRKARAKSVRLDRFYVSKPFCPSNKSVLKVLTIENVKGGPKSHNVLVTSPLQAVLTRDWLLQHASSSKGLTCKTVNGSCLLIDGCLAPPSRPSITPSFKSKSLHAVLHNKGNQYLGTISQVNMHKTGRTQKLDRRLHLPSSSLILFLSICSASQDDMSRNTESVLADKLGKRLHVSPLKGSKDDDEEDMEEANSEPGKRQKAGDGSRPAGPLAPSWHHGEGSGQGAQPPSKSPGQSPMHTDESPHPFGPDWLSMSIPTTGRLFLEMNRSFRSDVAAGRLPLFAKEVELYNVNRSSYGGIILDDCFDLTTAQEAITGWQVGYALPFVIKFKLQYKEPIKRIHAAALS